jgi:hypothetical protein
MAKWIPTYRNKETEIKLKLKRICIFLILSPHCETGFILKGIFKKRTQLLIKSSEPI